MTPAWLEAARRVGIVRLDRLGDMVLTLPMFPVLRRMVPRAELHLIARPYAAPVAQGLPVVDRVLTLSGARAMDEMDILLREQQYDVLVFPVPDPWHVWAAWRARVPHRIGTSRRWFSALYNHRVPGSRSRSGRHEAASNVAMLEHLVGQPQETRLVAPHVPEAAERAVAQALAARGAGPAARWLVVHPGAGQGSRVWPAERYGEAARTLAREFGLEVVVTGTRGEEALAEQVVAAVPGAVSLAGALTLDELKALLQRAELLLAASTGPLHLATAFNTRVVGIYRPRELERWRPLNPRGVAVIPEDRTAMLQGVTVEAVVRAAREVMQR